MQERMATPEGKQETFERGEPARSATASERDLDRFARARHAGARRHRLLPARAARLARGHRGGVGGHARCGHGGRGADPSRGHPAALGPRAHRVRGRDDVAARPGRHHRPAAAPHRARRSTRPRSTSRPPPSGPRIFELLRTSAEAVPEPPRPGATRRRRRSRRRRTTGSPSSRRSGRRCSTPATTGPSTRTSWTNALANLDASQIAIEMRGSIAV